MKKQDAGDESEKSDPSAEMFAPGGANSPSNFCSANSPIARAGQIAGQSRHAALRPQFGLDQPAAAILDKTIACCSADSRQKTRNYTAT